MAVDATVPVLVSLVLLALAVVAGAVANRAVSRPRRRPRSPLLSRRATAASLLRCPRVVLIDDAGRPGAGWWAASPS